MKIELKFAGYDSWNLPVYRAVDGTLFVDVDPVSHKKMRLCTKYKNCFNGEPDTPVEHTRFRNAEFEVDQRKTWW